MSEVASLRTRPATWLQSHARGVSRNLAVVVAVVGVSVLGGWAFHIEAVKSVFPGLVSMKPNSALAFVGLGIAIRLLDRRGERALRISVGLAIVVTIVGAATLIEYVSARDLGIDQLLFRESAGAAGTAFPGRMAPASAIAFVAMGLAVVFAVRRRGLATSRALTFLSASFAFFCLLLYGLGVKDGGVAGPYNQMALHTSITFLVAATAILLARPEGGLVETLIGSTEGGKLARRLIAVAIVLNLVSVGLQLAGERGRLFTPAFGDAASTTIALVVFGFALCLAAYRLDRAGAQRDLAELKLKDLNKSLERRVRSRTAELEASTKELEAFSYSVSHDLRAPVRAFDGLTRILARDYGDELPPEGRRKLDMMLSSAEQMSRLIDDLLMLSSIGQLGIKRQQIDMGALARDRFEIVHPEGSAGSVEFQVDDLPEATADPDLIGHVFTNLLDNAIKFSARNARAHVLVGSTTADGATTYFVRDDGVGFDPRYSDNLFKVFRRLHAPKDYEGSGVGLSIVERVISRHGGRVWAESTPGMGATFYFTLEGEYADA